MSAAVATKLREAKALIERGWCKGVFDKLDPATGTLCYCADGALSAVADGQWEPMASALKRAIRADRYTDIWTWNDSRADKAEVLAGFDKAIEIAERDQ